jgi:sarcosine oxidase subunit gamma
MEGDCVADEGITLADVEWGLAWNVRGNAAQAGFVSEATRLLGVALPLEPNTTARRSGATVLWLGPKSWLTVLVRDAIGADFNATRAAFNAAGGALFDLSSSYVGWKVSGPGSARVLNRNCPLDFHPRAFIASACAQSLLGHVNALYYRPGEADEFIVIVARSFAIDAWENLCAAAATDGYRVGPRAGF